MTPASAAGDSTPPCPGVPPYEVDERIIWAFECGIRDRFSTADVKRIAESLLEPSARIKFAAGAVAGAYDGAKLGLEEYIRSNLTLLKDIANWSLEFYSTVYDQQVLNRILAVYATAPNTAARLEALNQFADLYEERHPAGAMALRSLAEVTTTLERLAEWLGQPGTVARLLVAIGRELGEMLGNELERIRNLTGQPYNQGAQLGNILGQIVIQIALFELGL
jgi:hypothetical protein